MLSYADYDTFLLRQSDRDVDARSLEDEKPSRKEMLTTIAEANGIDTRDLLGKYLLLQLLLSKAPKNQAASIIDDTIDLFDDDTVSLAYEEAQNDD